MPLDITLRAIIRALSPPASAGVVPIPKVQATAPERIWLAVADDKHYADEPFPDGVEEVCWSHDAPLEVCVPYVRADLATPTPPATAQEDECEVVGACYSTRTLTVRLPVMPRSINVRSRATITLTSPDSGKEGAK